MGKLACPNYSEATPNSDSFNGVYLSVWLENKQSDKEIVKQIKPHFKFL